MFAKSKLSAFLSIVCSASLMMPIGIGTSGAAQAQMRRTNAKMAAFNCPNNRFTNGDFSNAPAGAGPGQIDKSMDQDIDLAVGWKAIWSTADNPSLADLYSATAPTPFIVSPPDGNFAAMWVSNRVIDGAGMREGMFNKLVTPIAAGTGTHSFTFTAANLETAGAGKTYIGIYGINRSDSEALPNAPINATTPSNINLFGASKSVLLAKVEMPVAVPKQTWQSYTVTFPTSTFGALPQVSHVMVTKLDAAEGATEITQNRYVAFDDFCMQTAADAGVPNTDGGTSGGNGTGGSGTGGSGSGGQVPVNTNCPGIGCTDQAYSTCCPPSANTKLSKMLASVQPTISDDYYLKFTLDPMLDAQMTAYGAYLKLLDPSYTGMAMTVRAFDGGSGNSPSVSGGPLEPEKAIYWNAGTTAGVQWPAGDLFSPATKRPVNNWTVVETVIWHTGPNRPWSMDCSIKRIAFRPQVVGGRALPGTRGFTDYNGAPPASAAKRPARR